MVLKGSNVLKLSDGSLCEVFPKSSNASSVLRVIELELRRIVKELHGRRLRIDDFVHLVVPAVNVTTAVRQVARLTERKIGSRRRRHVHRLSELGKLENVLKSTKVLKDNHSFATYRILFVVVWLRVEAHNHANAAMTLEEALEQPRQLLVPVRYGDDLPARALILAENLRMKKGKAGNRRTEGRRSTGEGREDSR